MTGGKAEEEYDEARYKEDLKISRWVFNKYLRLPASVKRFYEDDLISASIVKLWEHRKDFDETRGKYITFAAIISLQAMMTFIRKEERITNHFSGLSLEFEYETDTKFGDSFFEEFDFDENMNFEKLYNFCLQFINKMRGKTLKKVAVLYINGKRQIDIARELNISREYARQCVYRFSKRIQEAYKKEKEKFKNA